jgi:hypothetical protein
MRASVRAWVLLAAFREALFRARHDKLALSLGRDTFHL